MADKPAAVPLNVNFGDKQTAKLYVKFAFKNIENNKAFL